MVNYGKIVVEFTKAMPYRYIKINKLEYGIKFIWDEDKKLAFKKSQTAHHPLYGFPDIGAVTDFERVIAVSTKGAAIDHDLSQSA